MTREEILQIECNHLRQQLEQVQNSRQTAKQRASEAEIEVRI